MSYLYIMVMSTAVSLALTPAMMRLAPYFGMVDEPDPRKVHVQPIPRVGGWGIVAGALLSTCMLIPLDRTVLCYLFGVLVLFAVGSWDDRRELGHYTKFIGQLVAVLPLVTYGGLYISRLPLFSDAAIAPVIGIPFTVFALIGMINALNHSDGLDGLAGGEALLSLAAIGLLAYIVDGQLVLMIALAAIGGALGFLRYNTHPATVFMGDGGSQFLGFTLAFLAVLLTQRTDPSLSPAVVLFLLGLPIADILVVLGKRARQKMNWFLATRNHLHHRLLEMGFVHQESVVIIYSLQALFVVSGVFLRYESNWLIICLYVAACVAVFALVQIAERLGWQPHPRPSARGSLGTTLSVVRHQLLVVAPRRFLEVAIPAYLIVVSLSVTRIPRDFGVAAVGVCVVLVLEAFMSASRRSIVLRGLVYTIGAFIVYLGYNYPPAELPWLNDLRFAFFVAVAAAIALAVKFSPRRRAYEFETTAMDYLMIFIVLTSLVVVQSVPGDIAIGLFVVEVTILLYGCELLIIEKRERWTSLTLSSLGTALILAGRGLLPL